MAHFAEINTDTNEVLRVVVVNNSDVDANGGDYSATAETWVANNIAQDPEILAKNNGTYPNTYWKQTSYNQNARYNYAYIEGTWDETNKAFIDLQPYPSWSLDSNFKWVAPEADPATYTIDGIPVILSWDETNIRWIGYKDQDPFPEYTWNNTTSQWESTGGFKPY